DSQTEIWRLVAICGAITENLNINYLRHASIVITSNLARLQRRNRWRQQHIGLSVKPNKICVSVLLNNRGAVSPQHLPTTRRLNPLRNLLSLRAPLDKRWRPRRAEFEKCGKHEKQNSSADNQQNNASTPALMFLLLFWHSVKWPNCVYATIGSC